MCVSNQRERTLTNLLGSPVKVIKTKTSKRSTDLQFTRNSEIAPGGQLDFNIIDMNNLTIKDLQTLALECVVTVTATVKTRSKELETSSGLPFRILSVADSTEKVKVMFWGSEFINEVEEGQTYRFENLRIKADQKYGGITLGTTTNENTKIIPSDSLSDVVEGSLFTDTLVDTLQGQIIMVSKSMVEYVVCRKCKKKCDGDLTGDFLYCKNCDGEILKKRCKPMRVAKIDFEEDKTEKLYHLSIFSSVMDKMLATDFANIPQTDLRQKLLRLPTLIMRVSNNVVQSAEELKQEQ